MSDLTPRARAAGAAVALLLGSACILDLSLGLAGMWLGTWDTKSTQRSQSPNRDGGFTASPPSDSENSLENTAVTVEDTGPGQLVVILAGEEEGGGLPVNLVGFGNSYRLQSPAVFKSSSRDQTGSVDAGFTISEGTYKLTVTKVELTRSGSDIKIDGEYETESASSSTRNGVTTPGGTSTSEATFTFKGKRVARE